MEEKINIVISQLGDLRVKKNIDLNEYISSKPSGQASAIFIATSVAELIKAVLLCRELKLSYLVIGSGSKVEVLNFTGLIIKNRSQNLKIFGIKGQVSRSGIGVKEAFIEADSGVILSDLADFALKQNLEGFDDLRLSKGTVGGSILSNPLLVEKATQIRVLNNSDIEEVKDNSGLLKHDIFLKAVFHLKAREV